MLSLAATATDSNLATFDANEVTNIFDLIFLTTLTRFFLTVDSEPDLPAVNTFVESQTIANTSVLSFSNLLKLIGFPNIGS